MKAKKVLRWGEPDCGTPLQLLRLPDVIGLTGYSRSEIYRRLAAGQFPKPVRLGMRSRAWAHHEVVAWISARLEERDLEVKS